MAVRDLVPRMTHSAATLPASVSAVVTGSNRRSGNAATSDIAYAPVASASRSETFGSVYVPLEAKVAAIAAGSCAFQPSK